MPNNKRPYVRIVVRKYDGGRYVVTASWCTSRPFHWIPMTGAYHAMSQPGAVFLASWYIHLFLCEKGYTRKPFFVQINQYTGENDDK